MPLMRGIKFACEPCIRGHRSSKCNHSDRVLVQVRKPGRPLSSCPHTLSSSSPSPCTFVNSLPSGTSIENGAGDSSETGGVNCSCDVTSVAIPKIASCACGTPEPHGPPPRLSIAPSSPQNSPPTMLTSPVSPISPIIASTNSIINSSGNKVTKSHRPKRRDGPVRRGSVIIREAALELLLEQGCEGNEGTGSLGVRSGGNDCGEVTSVQNGNGSVDGNGIQEFMPTFSATIENEEGANVLHLSQESSSVQNGNVVPGNSKNLPMTNGGLVGANGILSQGIRNPDTAGSSPLHLPQITRKRTGCDGCNGKSPQSSQPQFQQQYMHHAPTLSNPQQGSGCCSNPKKTIPIQQSQQPISVPQSPSLAHQFFPALQYPPSCIPTPNFPQLPNPWMYPTINHRITHQEFAWLQQQRAAGLFGPQPMPQLPGHTSLPAPMVNNSTMVGNPLGNSWRHSCNCGSDCNCLGCVTHPFNRRTVEHVWEMQSFMAGDNGTSCPHSHSHSHQNFHNHTHSCALAQQLSQPQPQSQQNGSEVAGISLSPNPARSSPEGFNCNLNGTPASASSVSCCGNSSSQEEQHTPQPPEPEDNGTPGSTEPWGELSPNSFIYFDYPFGTCAQTETGCKCGDGCTCVGCITHDGVALDGNVEKHADWGAWGDSVENGVRNESGVNIS